MADKFKVKFESFDSGYCRAYFRTEKKSLICIQEDFKNSFNVYRCNEGEDGEREPESRLVATQFEFVGFKPTNEYAKTFLDYIEKLKTTEEPTSKITLD